MGGEGIVLIPGFLAISYVINTGAAFGLSTGDPLVNRIVYIVLASIISIGLIVYFCRKQKTLNKEHIIKKVKFLLLSAVNFWKKKLGADFVSSELLLFYAAGLHVPQAVYPLSKRS